MNIVSDFNSSCCCFQSVLFSSEPTPLGNNFTSAWKCWPALNDMDHLDSASRVRIEGIRQCCTGGQGK